jgi:hypothetical protein
VADQKSNRKNELLQFLLGYPVYAPDPLISPALGSDATDIPQEFQLGLIEIQVDAKRIVYGRLRVMTQPGSGEFVGCLTQ